MRAESPELPPSGRLPTRRPTGLLSTRSAAGHTRSGHLISHAGDGPRVRHTRALSPSALVVVCTRRPRAAGGVRWRHARADWPQVPDAGRASTLSLSDESTDYASRGNSRRFSPLWRKTSFLPWKSLLLVPNAADKWRASARLQTVPGDPDRAVRSPVRCPPRTQMSARYISR